MAEASREEPKRGLSVMGAADAADGLDADIYQAVYDGTVDALNRLREALAPLQGPELALSLCVRVPDGGGADLAGHVADVPMAGPDEARAALEAVDMGRLAARLRSERSGAAAVKAAATVCEPATGCVTRLAFREQRVA